MTSSSSAAVASGSDSRCSRFTLAFGLIGSALVTLGMLVAIILKVSPILWGHDVRYPQEHFNLGLRHVDIHPVPCSSHNDYWREKPLHSALAAGCIGVEADVWPFQDQLYVSHNRDRLATDRTLTALYIDPLIKILQGKNTALKPSLPTRGIYDTDPPQSLILLVDIKTNPRVAWPLLLQQLEPLRAGGFLSRISNGTLLPGPITVVASGTARIQDVEENPALDVFLDAPLAMLDDGAYTGINSYFASVSFRKSIGWIWFGGLRQSQLNKIRDHIRKAHSRRLKVRYWSLPTWPLSMRKQLWNILIDEGVDILHVDDVLGARNIFTGRSNAKRQISLPMANVMLP